jgi:endonuclease YncB( thermonuclease family)
VRGKAVRIVDGDTIVVALDGKDVQIRLLGSNAPEYAASGDERSGRAPRA